MDVNSAAIPGSLFEAELSGVAVGAFTDAREPRSDTETASHRARARILFREMDMRAPTTRAFAEATSTTAARGRVH